VRPLIKNKKKYKKGRKMKARVKGEVFRSIHQEGKKYNKTAITQSETETQTINVSTIKQYKPGEQIDLYCRVSVSLFHGKAYLIVQEIDEQSEKLMETGSGEQAKKAVKI
jgi:hypothetical protein